MSKGIDIEQYRQEQIEEIEKCLPNESLNTYVRRVMRERAHLHAQLPLPPIKSDKEIRCNSQ